MFYRKDKKYIKQYDNGKIEQIDLESMEVSTLSELPDFPKCQPKEYRFAQHQFFNSRDFEWMFEGRKVKTIPLDMTAMNKQFTNYLNTYKTEKGYPVFYMGKIWYFQYCVADYSFDCCQLHYYHKDGTIQGTITKSKNLKSIQVVD